MAEHDVLATLLLPEQVAELLQEALSRIGDTGAVERVHGGAAFEAIIQGYPFNIEVRAV
jgi:hypothetical protein